MLVIQKFRGRYSFLSNFYPCQIAYNGKTYPSVEHAYQAAKTHDKEWQERVRLADSPGKAKALGYKVPKRDDWELVKPVIMAQLVFLKFQDPQLRQKLLDTGSAKLEEGNTHDKFWGTVNGEGKNELGKILMRARDDAKRWLKERAERDEYRRSQRSSSKGVEE